MRKMRIAVYTENILTDHCVFACSQLAKHNKIKFKREFGSQ